MKEVVRRDSVWTRISTSSTVAGGNNDDDDTGVPEIDMGELASLFTAKRAAEVKLKTTDKSGGGGKGKKGSGADARGVLPMERVKNVGIFLKPLKLTKAEIKRAIARGDGNVLTDEVVDGLQKVLPTTKELELLRREVKRGATLSDEETFMFDVANVTSCRIRLAAVASRQRFEGMQVDVKRALPRLMRAADQLKGCTLLQRILGIVLQVGNAMNAGQTNGSATAFALDTLHCLKGVRPTQKPDPTRHKSVHTLLHFVAAECCKVGGYERRRCMLADKLNEVLSMVKFNVDCVVSGPGMLRNCLQQIDEGLTHVANAAGIKKEDVPILTTMKEMEEEDGQKQSSSPALSSPAPAAKEEKDAEADVNATDKKEDDEEEKKQEEVEKEKEKEEEKEEKEEVEDEEVVDTKAYIASMRDFVERSRVILDEINAEVKTSDAACADTVSFLNGRESVSGFKDFVAACVTLSTFIFDFDGAVTDILREREAQNRRSAHALGLGVRRRSMTVRKSPSQVNLMGAGGSSTSLDGIAENAESAAATDTSGSGLAHETPLTAASSGANEDGPKRRPLRHMRSKSLSAVPSFNESDLGILAAADSSLSLGTDAGNLPPLLSDELASTTQLQPAPPPPSPPPPTTKLEAVPEILSPSPTPSSTTTPTKDDEKANENEAPRDALTPSPPEAEATSLSVDISSPPQTESSMSPPS